MGKQKLKPLEFVADGRRYRQVFRHSGRKDFYFIYTGLKDDGMYFSDPKLEDGTRLPTLFVKVEKQIGPFELVDISPRGELPSPEEMIRNFICLPRKYKEGLDDRQVEQIRETNGIIALDEERFSSYGKSSERATGILYNNEIDRLKFNLCRYKPIILSARGSLYPNL